MGAAVPAPMQLRPLVRCPALHRREEILRSCIANLSPCECCHFRVTFHLEEPGGQMQSLCFNFAAAFHWDFLCALQFLCCFLSLYLSVVSS